MDTSELFWHKKTIFKEGFRPGSDTNQAMRSLQKMATVSFSEDLGLPRK